METGDNELALPARKALLRAKMMQWWRDLDGKERELHSAALSRHLIESVLLQDVDKLLVFSPLPSEPDLTALFDHLATTRTTLVFPRVEEGPNPGDRSLGLYASDPAESSHWKITRGLQEPIPSICPAVPIAKIEVILVPGLVFSLQTGARLGRGAGYYDRLLGHIDNRATSIGICFQEQLLPSLPTEPHDKPVEFIATEERVNPTGAAGKP